MQPGVPRMAIVLGALALGAVAVSANAQDARIEEGKRKAIACQGCHGMDGIARLPDAPHIAAQPAAYLERALRAYRSGERKNEVMSIAAKGLTDADIAALSAYYAAVRIEVKSTP
jgi:cytochrome c553